MNLRGRHVVITGASSGIGRATAIEFARNGASVTLAARRAEALERVAAECRESGVRAEAITCDVSSADQCRSLIEAAVAIAPVDVLVNNAGFAIFDRVADASPSDFEQMMQTNYFGTVYCTKAVLPYFQERKRGAIVNVASIGGIMGFAGMSGYCATKFAIVGFTEALRDEVIGSGIKVALVCPGTTDTDFFITAERGKMPAANRLILAIPPEKVAKRIVRAAASGAARTIVPFTAAAFMRFKEALPRSAHFLMRHVSAIVRSSSR